MLLYSRAISLVAFLICLGLLGFAAYLQYTLGLQPCPLCVIQRLCMAILAVLFMVGALYIPRTKSMRRGLSLFSVIIAFLGFLTAIRHIWLENEPPGTVSSCGPNLDTMLQSYPISDTLRQLLNGSGDCAQVTWQFLNMSIPAWGLIFFSIFLILGVLRVVRAG